MLPAFRCEHTPRRRPTPARELRVSSIWCLKEKKTIRVSWSGSARSIARGREASHVECVEVVDRVHDCVRGRGPRRRNGERRAAAQATGCPVHPEDARVRPRDVRRRKRERHAAGRCRISLGAGRPPRASARRNPGDDSSRAVLDEPEPRRHRPVPRPARRRLLDHLPSVSGQGEPASGERGPGSGAELELPRAFDSPLRSTGTSSPTGTRSCSLSSTRRCKTGRTCSPRPTPT